jgi:hypothetical protein
LTNGLTDQTRVAVITPYAQQAGLLRRSFEELLGPQYAKFVEVNTVDAFQGREANIVIFSCVRAAGSKGIGFLSDVRRMNVALTRAKHFLFVIARCESIIVNPYWKDLVDHARETHAVFKVPLLPSRGYDSKPSFPPLRDLQVEIPAGETKHQMATCTTAAQDSAIPRDPRLAAATKHMEVDASKPKDPRRKPVTDKTMNVKNGGASNVVGAPAKRAVDPRRPPASTTSAAMAVDPNKVIKKAVDPRKPSSSSNAPRDPRKPPPPAGPPAASAMDPRKKDYE